MPVVELERGASRGALLLVAEFNSFNFCALTIDS